MILEISVCKQGDSKNTTKTHHQLEERIDDIVAWGKAYVDILNKGKAAFEKHYILKGVKEFHMPDPSDPKVHDWQKTSFNLYGSSGSHHLVRCDKCGITGVKHDKNVFVKIDEQYKAKYYQNCSEVIKRKAS